MQQALDISSNTKLFTSYFQNNIIVQKYFHMDGNSIFIAFQWSARGKGKIFEKNNVYMCVCVTFALKVDTCTLIPSYFYDAIQDLVLSCKLYSTTSFCFDAPSASGSVRFLLLLLNDLEDFPQAACDHQSNLFLEQFFFFLKHENGNRFASKNFSENPDFKIWRNVEFQWFRERNKRFWNFVF